MLGDDTVHEVEKLDAPAPLVLAARHLASGDVESGEKRRHAVPDVIVRLARQRPAVRHFQVTLRALQRLDRRLLVDGEDQSVLGRLHVKADHRGRLGGERGIVALAPALAGGKTNLVSPQEAPDILHPDLAEGRGDQRPGPARIAGGNWLIERRQNALVVGLRIFWIVAALAGFPEAAKPTLSVARPYARDLNFRLESRRPNDKLAQSFQLHLSTLERQRLLHILRTKSIQR